MSTLFALLLAAPLAAVLAAPSNAPGAPKAESAPAAPHGGAPYRGPSDPAPFNLLTLPPSAAADQLAASAPLPEDYARPQVPSWQDSAWDSPAPWEAWSAALAAPGEPASRVTLALIARAQGRYDAMWGHIEALPAGWARALIHDLHTPVLRDGQPALFTPPLPPFPRHDPTSNTLPPKRLTTFERVRVGESYVNIIVEDTPEGVEASLQWLAGPPLDIEVELPIPYERRTRILYFDWDRVEPGPDGALPRRHTIHVAPRPEQTDQDWVLWARCKPVWIAVPRLGATALPERLPDLKLATTAKDPWLERVRGFAALLEASLGVNATVAIEAAGAPAQRTHSPLRIDLTPGADREGRWLDLLSQVETAALAAGGREESR